MLIRLRLIHFRNCCWLGHGLSTVLLEGLKRINLPVVRIDTINCLKLDGNQTELDEFLLLKHFWKSFIFCSYAFKTWKKYSCDKNLEWVSKHAEQISNYEYFDSHIEYFEEILLGVIMTLSANFKWLGAKTKHFRNFFANINFRLILFEIINKVEFEAPQDTQQSTLHRPLLSSSKHINLLGTNCSCQVGNTSISMVQTAVVR